MANCSFRASVSAMAVAPCPRCGTTINTKADACPRSGNPLRRTAALLMPKEEKKGGGWWAFLLLGAGVIYWIIHSNGTAPKTPEPKLDWSRPIYLREGAWVCPQSLIFKTDFANSWLDAANSISKREEK